MKKQFTQHKWNAIDRGVEFLFTFEQWRDWWLATGKWEQRGRGRGKYCMRRYGDIGPYSVENVFCGTNEDNVRDAQVGDKNPMKRQDVREKVGAATRGGKHYRAKMVATPHGIWTSAIEAAKCIGIPKPTVEWRCRNNHLGFSYIA